MTLNKPGCSDFGSRKKRDLEIYRSMWEKYAKRFRQPVAARTPEPEFAEPEFFSFPDVTIPTLPPLRVDRVDVALGDTVSYKGNTITVSRGGRVVGRIRNIARLVTRDASGGDHTFSRDAVELRPGGARETIQLRGPGEILVIFNTATFLRDSKAIALSAIERKALRVLTNELFNLIQLANDIDISDFIEDILDDLNPIRDLPQFPDIPNPLPQLPSLPFSRARRADAGAQFFSLPRELVNTSAIITSVLFESSCNPVVHAAASSTLSIATQQNPFRVQNIREFMDLEKGLLPLS